MTVAITIRDVPDDVREALAARAASEGRSMQQYLLALLSESVRQPTVDEVIKRARARVRSEGTRVDTEWIIEARDADRR